MTIAELTATAQECGYRQVPWARDAGINTTRLNLAINGHLTLKDCELSALEAALRSFISGRATKFIELLSTGVLAEA